MTALVSAELLKLRTTRTAFGFFAITVLLILLLQGVTFATVDINTKRDVEDAFGGAGIATIVLLILGIVATTGEYRHRTITGSLLATPDRRRYLASKLIAYVLTGAVLGAVAMAVTLVVGLPWLAVRDQPTELFSTADFAFLVLRAIAATAISGAIGVAIGAIVRNQVAAVVGILLYLFIVEPVIGLISDDVLKFTLGQSQSSLLGGAFSEGLAPGYAALVYAGWALLLAALGVALEQRRDVT
ncbi:MAG TPA: ABC transporter permease [Thermoleophilaceae bacterium]